MRVHRWEVWIAASAVLAIAGALAAPVGLGLHYVFKPITTLLLVALAWRSMDPLGPRLAIGGALFVLSDGLLAWDRFASPLPLAPLWVLSSYWAAQWCIARSVAPEGRHG